MPEALLQQLKNGGRMVIPVGAQGVGQKFIQVDKSASGAIKYISDDNTAPPFFEMAPQSVI